MKLGVLFSLLGFAASSSAGPATFFVYRAENSKSPWHSHLFNADAANEAGVLSYVHSEVIPLDMGSGKSNNCQRKFDIDVIMKYKVTVVNPPSYPTPPEAGYKAFDGGKCGVPGCAADYALNGFYVGQQNQQGNPRHRYDAGQWYSFPGGGHCAAPDGSHDCSYLARLVGRIKLDDLVDAGADKDEIAPDYHTWCEKGGVEFARDPNNMCTVTQSIKFWEGICDSQQCASRVSTLESVKFNTNLTNGCDGESGLSFYYSRDIGCVDTCPDDTFADWDYTCQACPAASHCGTCSWAMSPTDAGGKCTTCNQSGLRRYLDLVSGTCVLKCPAGTQPDAKGVCRLPATSAPTTTDSNITTTAPSSGGSGTVTAAPTTSPSKGTVAPTPASAGSTLTTPEIVAIVVGGVVVLGFGAWCCFRKREDGYDYQEI